MAQTTGIRLDPTNAAQADAWDGDEGRFWVAHAERFDRALAPHEARLLAATAVGEDERVLDIGCGTGQSTRAAARRARRGSALGVDLSSDLVELARRLAAEQGLANAFFERTDAQVHPFEDEFFDVAISRTGTMFFGDPTAAFSNVARALRPGGRLTLVTWQGPGQNEWVRELGGALAAGRQLPLPAIGRPGPFGQADPDQVTTVLRAAGFDRIEISGFTAPMWFGTDVEDAHRYLLDLMGWMREGLDDAGRERADAALRAVLTEHQDGSGVSLGSAAWLVRARRR